MKIIKMISIVMVSHMVFGAISHTQAKGNASPSLVDTLQWITNKLENYQFGTEDFNYTYFKPIIIDCKITTTLRAESPDGKAVIDSTVSGKLSDIDPDFIRITEGNEYNPVELVAYIKKESTPFERKWVMQYFKNDSFTNKISNHEDKSFKLFFHSLAFANRFKKAISHAAEQCVQIEDSKPRQDIELF